MLEIHVYSSGDIVYNVINAISMFMSSYESELLSLCAMIGLPITAYKFSCNPHPKVLGEWAAVTLLVPVLLLETSSDVEIVDSSQPMQVYSVSNVPHMVSAPAYLTTYLGYNITAAVESIFHTNDDAAYTQTGMLFGSTLYQNTFSANISDPALRYEWGQFVTNCIRPDININHKYTYAELMASNDVFSFLDTYDMSPVRSIRSYPSSSGDTTTMTCATALPYLSNEFDSSVSTWFDSLRNSLSGYSYDVLKTNTTMQEPMDDFASDVLDISQTSIELTKQIMAINGMKQGVLDKENQLGDFESMRSFMEAQTEAQSLGFMVSTGLWAQKKIPMLHTILLMIAMCGGIVTLGICMIPTMAKNVFFGYLKGYLYLSSWPICFAFINFIGSLYLETSLSSLVSDDGGLSLQNLDIVTLKNLDGAAICGWLMSLTPVMSIYLVKGAASIASSASHSFAGMMSSVSGGVAREAATGNISLGNTNLNNHSLDNYNAHKHDLTHSDRYFGARSNDRSGIEQTDFSGGKSVYDSNPAISKLPLNINDSNTQSKLLSNAVREQSAEVEAAREARSSAISDTASKLEKYGKNITHSGSYGTNYAHSDQSQSAKDYAELQNMVQEYAKSHQVSESSAWNRMLEGYVTGSAGKTFGGKNSLIGRVAGVDASIRAGAKASAGKSWTDSTQDSEQSSDRSSAQQAFNNKLSSFFSDTRTESADNKNSNSRSGETAVSDSLANIETANRAFEVAYSKQQSFEAAYTQSQNHSLNLGENLSNEFQDYVVNQAQHTNLFNGLTPKQILTGTNQEAREYRDDLAQSFLENKLAGTSNLASPESLTPQELKSKAASSGVYESGRKGVVHTSNEASDRTNNLKPSYDTLHEIDTMKGVDDSIIGGIESLQDKVKGRAN